MIILTSFIQKFSNILKQKSIYFTEPDELKQKRKESKNNQQSDQPFNETSARHNQQPDQPLCNDGDAGQSLFLAKFVPCTISNRIETWYIGNSNTSKRLGRIHKFSIAV